MAAPISYDEFIIDNDKNWSTDGSVTFGVGEQGRYASLYAQPYRNFYTTMKRVVHLNAGDTLSGYAQFLAHDYMPYNDDAFVWLDNTATLFGSNVATVGNFGTSAWTHFAYTATNAGNYILRVGVANRRDEFNPSEIRVAQFAVIPKVPEVSEVPEPGSLALLGLGLVGAGAVRRTLAKKKQA